MEYLVGAHCFQYIWKKTLHKSDTRIEVFKMSHVSSFVYIVLSVENVTFVSQKALIILKEKMPLFVNIIVFVFDLIACTCLRQ